MALFPLSTACWESVRLYPEHFTKVRDTIDSLYRERDLLSTHDLNIECALFINWCMDIVIRNSAAHALDRWVANMILRYNICNSLRREVSGKRYSLSAMIHLYQSRYREILGTIWNIYLIADSKTPPNPLGVRTSRLFLQRSTRSGQHLDPSMLNALSATLSALFRGYVRMTARGLKAPSPMAVQRHQG